MNGKRYTVCGAVCRIDEGVILEGDGIVDWKGEVLTGEIRACRKCEKLILAARAQGENQAE